MVLAVLAAVVVVLLDVGGPTSGGSVSAADVARGGVLQAAGLLFFAFAGYARIATLGEEVRDPARTIPRAVPMALGIALVVYACVAVAVLSVLGAAELGRGRGSARRGGAGRGRAVAGTGGAGRVPRWPRSARCWR